MLWPYKTHEISTKVDKKRGIQVTDIRPRRRKLRQAVTSSNPRLVTLLLLAALFAATAALLATAPTASASPSPSLHEVCTGKTWPPPGALIAEVCQVISTHPEGPCGSQPWEGWNCRTLGDRQCGGALGGRGVLR